MERVITGSVDVAGGQLFVKSRTISGILERNSRVKCIVKCFFNGSKLSRMIGSIPV